MLLTKKSLYLLVTTHISVNNSVTSAVYDISLVGKTPLSILTYLQAIQKPKTYTQLILRFWNPTHSYPQTINMNRALITTPDSTFAHLHSPNNKE